MAEFSPKTVAVLNRLANNRRLRKARNRPMDIVESLRRSAASASHNDPMRGVLFTCGEAANEIERLRTVLRNIAALEDHRSGDLRDAFDMAREALKEYPRCSITAS